MSERFRKILSTDELQDILNRDVQSHELVVHVEGVSWATHPPTYGWAIYVDAQPPEAHRPVMVQQLGDTT